MAAEAEVLSALISNRWGARLFPMIALVPVGIRIPIEVRRLPLFLRLLWCRPRRRRREVASRLAAIEGARERRWRDRVEELSFCDRLRVD